MKTDNDDGLTPGSRGGDLADTTEGGLIARNP
jgi:hypothetical protein